jgi:hypothetical protein
VEIRSNLESTPCAYVRKQLVRCKSSMLYLKRIHIVEAKGTHNEVDVLKLNRCPYPITVPFSPSQEQRDEASPMSFQKRMNEDLVNVPDPSSKSLGDIDRCLLGNVRALADSPLQKTTVWENVYPGFESPLIALFLF